MNDFPLTDQGTDTVKQKSNLFSLARLLVMPVLFLMGLHPAVCSAGYPSIAYGSDHKWAWAVRDTRKEADATAISRCNERAAVKDCKLSVGRAVAKAMGANKTSFGRSDVSVADARAEALRSCGEPDCRVIDVWTTPGFYSLTRPKDGDGQFYMVFGGSDSDQVDTESIEACEKRNGKPCGVVWSSALGGKLEESPQARPAPVPAATVQDCRPRTPVSRCRSQCVNGACTVSYENGCRIHVDVSPEFDGFTNQWIYPTPSC